MKYNCKKYIFIFLLIIATMSLISCNATEFIKNKFSPKTDYFDFVKSGSIDSISIENTRDKGFKLIVTESNAISDMHKLLSKSKVSETKSNLEPDYIFKFDLGEQTKEFKYIVGIDNGNFYNDEETFSVPKRLEEGMIKNLSFIRTPREFSYVYYNSLLEVIEILEKKEDIKTKKVGINIEDDLECLKYIYSIDLKKFINDAKKMLPNVSLVDGNDEEFDVVINMKNRGYDSTNFKTKISIRDNATKVSYDFFVVAENKFKNWDIKISPINQEPQNW